MLLSSCSKTLITCHKLNFLTTNFTEILYNIDGYIFIIVKVESIGDAFLVIAGVGEKKESHADRIANTALGMLITAREIRSPLDGDPIQVGRLFDLFHKYS